MDLDELNRRHWLIGANKCPECEKKVTKLKNRLIPQVIHCECGNIWMTYPGA